LVYSLTCFGLTFGPTFGIFVRHIQRNFRIIITIVSLINLCLFTIIKTEVSDKTGFKIQLNTLQN